MPKTRGLVWFGHLVFERVPGPNTVVSQRLPLLFMLFCAILYQFPAKLFIIIFSHNVYCVAPTWTQLTLHRADARSITVFRCDATIIYAIVTDRANYRSLSLTVRV
jgi:hypothetical protein